jgi:hypothetical protein
MLRLRLRPTTEVVASSLSDISHVDSVSGTWGNIATKRAVSFSGLTLGASTRFDVDFFVFGGFHAEAEADHRGGSLQPLGYQPRGLRLRHLREHYNKAGIKLFRYQPRGLRLRDLQQSGQ